MNTHVQPWLPAYYDGELSSSRLSQVRAHLAECAECRAELEELRQLTTLLRSVPAPAAVRPSDRFAAQVKLRLPAAARPQTPWQKSLGIAWRWTPIGLIVLWAAMQAGLAAVALLMLAGQPEPVSLPQMASLSGWGWAVALLNSFMAGSLAVWLAPAIPWLELGLVNLLLTAGLAVLLWGWVASWWAQRRHRRAAQSDLFQPERFGALDQGG